MIAMRLQKGQVLTPEAITALKQEDEYERAKAAILNFLGHRPRSRREIENKLREKEFSPQSVEKAIERLEALNYIDDRAFAKYWMNQRNHFKPRSRFALQQELAQKGVDREIIDEIVSDVDELDAATRAAEKKLYRFRSLPEDEFRKKLGGFLQRRGFGYEIVNEVLQTSWQSIADEEE